MPVDDLYQRAKAMFLRVCDAPAAARGVTPTRSTLDLATLDALLARCE